VRDPRRPEGLAGWRASSIVAALLLSTLALAPVRAAAQEESRARAHMRTVCPDLDPTIPLRYRRVRIVGWATAAAGVAILGSAGAVTSYAARRNFYKVGSVVAFGGTLTGIVGGSMYRRRCRIIERYRPRFSHRATIAGVSLMGMSALFLATGAALMVREPWYLEEDNPNSLMTVLVAFVPASAMFLVGGAVLAFGLAHRDDRLQVAVGPGSVHLVGVW